MRRPRPEPCGDNVLRYPDAPLLALFTSVWSRQALGDMGEPYTIRSRKSTLAKAVRCKPPAITR